MVEVRPTGAVIRADLAPALQDGQIYRIRRSGPTYTFEELEPLSVLSYPAVLELAGGTLVDILSREVWRKSVYPPFREPVHLSPKEWVLYGLLAAHPNEPVDREVLIRTLEINDRTKLRAWAMRLRRKLMPSWSKENCLVAGYTHYKLVVVRAVEDGT